MLPDLKSKFKSGSVRRVAPSLTPQEVRTPPSGQNRAPTGSGLRPHQVRRPPPCGQEYPSTPLIFLMNGVPESESMNLEIPLRIRSGRFSKFDSEKSRKWTAQAPRQVSAHPFPHRPNRPLRSESSAPDPAGANGSIRPDCTLRGYSSRFCSPSFETDAAPPNAS